MLLTAAKALGATLSTPRGDIRQCKLGRHSDQKGFLPRFPDLCYVTFFGRGYRDVRGSGHRRSFRQAKAETRHGLTSRKPIVRKVFAIQRAGQVGNTNMMLYIPL